MIQEVMVQQQFFCLQNRIYCYDTPTSLYPFRIYTSAIDPLQYWHFNVRKLFEQLSVAESTKSDLRHFRKDEKVRSMFC